MANIVLQYLLVLIPADFYCRLIYLSVYNLANVNKALKKNR